MMVAYVDSSVLVAVAFAEPGYEALVAYLDQAGSLYASNLVEAEVRAALRRESVTSDKDLFARLSWVLPDRPLTAEIGTVLDAGPLRGADLWHVACALYLSPIPQELSFVSLDERQTAVAVAVGFPGLTNTSPSG